MKKILAAFLALSSVSAFAAPANIPCQVFLEVEVYAMHSPSFGYSGGPAMPEELRYEMFNILRAQGYELVPEVLANGYLADRLEITTRTYVNDPKYTMTEVKIKNHQNVPGSFYTRNVLRDELLGSVMTPLVFGKPGRQSPNKKIWNEMIRALPDALPTCTRL